MTSKLYVVSIDRMDEQVTRMNLRRKSRLQCTARTVLLPKTILMNNKNVQLYIHHYEKNVIEYFFQPNEMNIGSKE